MQTTLLKSVTLSGVGLHSGRPARLTLRPATADQGIWFRRTDAVEGDPFLAARWDLVEQSPLCTLLKNDDGVTLSTVVSHVISSPTYTGRRNSKLIVRATKSMSPPIFVGSVAVNRPCTIGSSSSTW